MNNNYLINHYKYKQIITEYKELLNAIKAARLRRIETEYIKEKAEPKVNELKQELRSAVSDITDDLLSEMDKFKNDYDNKEIDVTKERYRNDLEQSKIKLMNKNELIEYAKGLKKADVTPQILSELKSQVGNYDIQDTLLETRIDELKPYALHPYMRDDKYLELDNQLKYINNAENDLYNGTLHFEDGTLSNIEQDVNEWINKNHYNDPKAEFRTKETWEEFI